MYEWIIMLTDGTLQQGFGGEKQLIAMLKREDVADMDARAMVHGAKWLSRKAWMFLVG